MIWCITNGRHNAIASPRAKPSHPPKGSLKTENRNKMKTGDAKQPFFRLPHT
ncbi:hypothetical protein [Kingella oralis]|uniref:hypothetical protein n=1 Tax=Kingella oralis TaxID=505 RepID=UPI00030283CA|nr:hypothetical protein [Kingella oralis]